MNTEFEATFTNIIKEQIQSKLREVGAELVRPEFLQKRVVFNLPTGHEIPGGWLRVRDEGEKITMSLKVIAKNEDISDQKELQLTIDNFAAAEELLTLLGCQRKAFQESKRELWLLEGVEITIDEWPFLEPFVEIEGKNEAEVIRIAEKLGFNYSEAYFGAAGDIYAKKYGISPDRVNNHTPEILFDSPVNPFLN